MANIQVFKGKFDFQNMDLYRIDVVVLYFSQSDFLTSPNVFVHNSRHSRPMHLFGVAITIHAARQEFVCF